MKNKLWVRQERWICKKFQKMVVIGGNITKPGEILNAIHPADFDALHKMSIGPNIVEYTKIHGTTWMIYINVWTR